jgi:hypothetical protein
MSYEPELNDPIFYADEPEPKPPSCFICEEELGTEEIIWADEAGKVDQASNKETETYCRTWCVMCIENEGETE